MTLTHFDFEGDRSTDDQFASAEALAQSVSMQDAVAVDEDVFWMFDTQRLEKNPPVERMSSGARAALAMKTEDEEILSTLASDPDVYVRWRVSRNGNIPMDARDTLYKEGFVTDNMRLSDFARMSTVSVPSLTLLAIHYHRGVRTAVAGNEKTPIPTLITLSHDENWDVRRGVARNPKTPADTLIMLADDEDRELLILIAKHENTPSFILDRLAKHDDKSVRIAAKGNPNYKSKKEGRDQP